MIEDFTLPISYDWFLVGSRLLIAFLLLAFLWRVMIIVARESFSASPSRQQMALALIDDSGQVLRGFRLARRRPVMIGRDTSNDIVLTDRSVSGKHAVVRLIGADWVLADLDSRNGTFVNDQAVSPEIGISEGDIVQFGAVRLLLVNDESNF